jgi:hypothetical protein
MYTSILDRYLVGAATGPPKSCSWICSCRYPHDLTAYALLMHPKLRGGSYHTLVPRHTHRFASGRSATMAFRGINRSLQSLFIPRCHCTPAHSLQRCRVRAMNSRVMANSQHSTVKATSTTKQTPGFESKNDVFKTKELKNGKCNARTFR